MPTSERITWTSCPECSGRAAVGWRDAEAVEVDCVNGCGVAVDQLPAGGDGLLPDASPFAAGG